MKINNRKYHHCIFMESDEFGVMWYVTPSDNKRKIVKSGSCAAYNQAVTESEKAFNSIPLKER